MRYVELYTSLTFLSYIIKTKYEDIAVEKNLLIYHNHRPV